MSVFRPILKNTGGVPERPKGTDCKSVGEAFGGSNPPPTTLFLYKSYIYLRMFSIITSSKASLNQSVHKNLKKRDRLSLSLKFILTQWLFN